MRDGVASQTGTTLMAVLRAPRDPEAWRAFVDRYGPRVHSWCRRWGLQDADAEDVTADVLVKLCTRMQTFTYDPAKGSFRGWLKTVTDHAVSDSLARRANCQGSGDSRVQMHLERMEARQDLQAYLAESFDLELLDAASTRVQLRVNRKTWTAFTRLAIEDRSEKEVAHELGMSIAALYMAKSRVQKMLKEEIRILERNHHI